MALFERVIKGDQRAIARAISVVENDSVESAVLIKKLFRQSGHAIVVGVTGAPGVGKSTLVDRLVSEWRRIDSRVGVLAIDPTSPFSGGAILGDRIRMQTHIADDGVYVRSMATRGQLGGLAHATSDAVVILAAAGYDVVVIETVGVGQGEVDIAKTADVSIVVTVPGAGDDVQTLKAGIMEIGDIFVVNKTDYAGADRTAGEIQAMLGLQEFSENNWKPPVLRTQASTGEGVMDVLKAISQFDAQKTDKHDRRLSRARFRLLGILRDTFIERLEVEGTSREALSSAIKEISEGQIDPYTAAEKIMGKLQ